MSGYISGNLSKLRARIPENVKIVAVSKTKTLTEIREAMESGQSVFGENKAQELSVKHERLPEAEWHFIGHLQSNKAKYIASFITMIHSIDSFRLLEEINRQAQRNGRVIDCLLQIHIAREETKFGLSEEEAVDLLEKPALKQMENIRICGLMGIATNTDDEDVIRAEFRELAGLFEKMKRNYFPGNAFFKELSMGMSEDYEIAIEEGSTMIRIGSLIFGERSYS
jgi:pyridoxal phosphate enzyme (YggS family)